MGGRYDSHKCQIIFLIVVLKETDALEDVFLGRLQQAGHFGTGARIMALRQMAVTALICIGIICRDSIQASLLFGIAVSLLTGICMLASEKELIWEKAEKRKNTEAETGRNIQSTQGKTYRGIPEGKSIRKFCYRQ